MSLTKRWWSAGTGGVILSLLLAACGGTPGAQVTSVPATQASNPQATAPAQETTAPPASGATGGATGNEFTFGMVLVGPYNDHGWSEANYSAGQYVQQKVPGTKMVWIDKVNPADRPGTTVEQVIDDLIAKGAKLILTTSDDFKDGTRNAAQKHPEVPFVHVSGDDVLTGKAPANLGNVMGRMEDTKMIGGCAAALTTQTGKIGYLGPLINDETRRLASSAYLGARYCYEKYRGKKADDLKFRVTWIGFWFNIPGQTLDPTQEVNQFFDSGYDVVMSGIDTTEALTVAGQRAKRGDKVWAVPYDFRNACSTAPDVCVGVPYFNWGPAYTRLVKQVMSGAWKPAFEWNPPDWKDLNNPDTTAVGFLPGPALSKDNLDKLQQFIGDLGSGAVVLWKGPLKLQDSTEYLKEGEVATDKQIWFLPGLLQGMEGTSK